MMTIAGSRSQLLLLFFGCSHTLCMGWMPSVQQTIGPRVPRPIGAVRHGLVILSSSSDAWTGEVAANTANGAIKGCTIQPVGASEPILEWIVTIDGVEADLGRFSEAIYNRVTAQAKKERFQGFRPGTIPPHIEPTYRAFAMDECARETVLEAMQQNNIKPFENSRSEFVLENFNIPPPTTSKKSTKKKSKKSAETASTLVEEVSEESNWRNFATMKETIDAGWRPGQSFSFVAKKVKGQQVKSDSQIQGASPIGLRY